MTVIERILRWNPLAARYAFHQLRARNLLINVSMYLTTLAIILVVEKAMGGIGFRGLFHKLMVLQVLLLCIFGLYSSGSVVRDEQKDRSLDFFRLVPVTPHARIVGLLVGRNLVLLAMGAINLMMAVLCGFLSDLDPLLVIEVAALTTVLGVGLMLVAILSSTYALNRRTSGGPMGLLILCVFLLPYLFGLAAYGAELYPEGAFGYFFGLRFRLLSLITLVILYFDFWVYRGLLRRFRRERESLFTPAGVILFSSGFCFLMLGLFLAKLQAGSSSHLISLISITSIPLVLIPFGAGRSHDDYVETVLGSRIRLRLCSSLSNVYSWLAADGIWFVTALIGLRTVGQDLPVSALLVLLSFWMTLQWLYETAVVCAPLTARVTQAAWFTAILLIGLPLLLGGLFRSTEWFWLSPIGFLGMLSSLIDPHQHSVTYTVWAWCSPLCLNFILLGVFGRIITMRYRGINSLALDIA